MSRKRIRYRLCIQRKDEWRGHMQGQQSQRKQSNHINNWTLHAV